MNARGMNARGLTLVLIFSFASGQARSQDTAPGFHWHKGQVLLYRVHHVTKVSEVMGGMKSEIQSDLNLLKRWEITAVDDKGIASVTLSLVNMRSEQKLPSGETLLFDSAHPEKGTTQFREQMEKYVRKPLATIRVDGTGKVVSVESSMSSASQYESDPPFVARIPAQTLQVGQGWERSYVITLDPPLGTGEKYQGLQKYQVTGADNGLLRIRLSTTIKNLPESAGERVPLLQKLPVGDIVFNARAGRLESARLQIDQQVTGHQGEGSSYSFTSTYVEEYAGDSPH